jgi:hypothetical protein
MKIYSFIYLIFIVFFCGCFSNSKYHLKDKESKLLQEWKADSLGCLHYRTKEKAIYIRDSLNLINKSTDFVIRKLGIPNSLNKDANKEILKYYFNTSCRENVFIDSLDYCWVGVLIESDLVINIEVSCY